MSKNDGMTIVEFLEARIAEDETKAREGLADSEAVYGAWGFFEPSRVLVECATKRTIIESYQNVCNAAKSMNLLDTRLTIGGMEEGLRIALVAMTYPYRGHSDWRKEWVTP